jgi:hypothetical protein
MSNAQTQTPNSPEPQHELTDEQLTDVVGGAETTAREAGSGMATGRRQYEPLRF